MATKRNASPHSFSSPAKKPPNGFPGRNWNGIISRPVSGSTKEELDADLFTPVPTELDEEKMMIGNMEGHQIFAGYMDTRSLLQQTRAEISELKASNENIQESHNRLQESHSRLQESHSRLQESHNRLQGSHQDLKETYQDLLGSHLGLKESHQRLQGSHQSLHETYQDLLGSHQDLEETYQDLQGSHQDLKESHQRLQESHNYLQGSHQDVKESHQRLQESHNRLQGSHQGLQETYQGLQGAYQDLNETYQGLMRSHACLELSHNILRKSHENLRNSFKEMKGFACERRGFALNEWGEIKPNSTDKHARNASVHGGDVIQDITTISNMDTVSPGRAFIWKRVFEKHYGIDYDTCESSVAFLRQQPRLVYTLNTLANIRTLYRWQNEENAERKKEIATRCRGIINEWRSRANCVFGPESEAARLYDEAMELYYA